MVLSNEQARAQAWEMMLEMAREVQEADPKAAAAAKALLADPAWKEIIEEGLTASPVPETAGKAASKLPDLSAEPELLREFLEKFYQEDPSYGNIDVEIVKDYLLTLSQR